MAKLAEMLKKPQAKIAAAVASVVLAFIVGMQLSTDRGEIKVEEISLTASVRSELIEVSEADTMDTRIQAYANNVLVYYNGEEVNTSGTVVGEQYIFDGGQMVFTEDENGTVTVTIKYGAKEASTWFTADEHQLITDANGTTKYQTPSYGYQFDEVTGEKVNDGSIVNHENDLDADGNIIGIQDESKVVMDENFIPDSKPAKVESESTSGNVVVTEKSEVTLPENFTPATDNAAGGASMENVETTVDVVETNPEASYRQITIANANGNHDGTTLNFVSTNGGEGTLVVMCLSVEGNTYHCVDAAGNSIDLTVTYNGINASFSGITGIYQ